ncbi:MAG: apolipoprotein N-acyltransferase [Candidatus Acidiferrales bacterium]
MKLSRPLRIAFAIVSGIALGLSFPNYNLPLLAWGAIALLILASVGAGISEAPLYGFLHGLVFYPTCLPWIDVVMRQYGNVDPLDAAGILALIGIAGGIILMIFSTSLALVSRRSKPAAFALAPFLWVTLEFARTHLPIIGFPWNLTGYAASGNLAFLQLTPLTGIFGLSFVIAAFNAVLAWAIWTRTRRSIQIVCGAAAALLLIAFAGPHFVPSQTPRYVAHLVQTNFPQSEHYPENWMQLHSGELDELANISVDAARKMPGLIVWPEVPAPFSFQDLKFVQRVQKIARDSGQYFLFGVEDWRLDANRQWDVSNSAVLLNPAGERVFTYDKIHMVPFGEYVPLRRWIKFAGRLTADIADFTPGTEYRVGQLPGGRFGTFICYEAIFPGEIRNFAANGAGLLINISNDGWFGRSAAPAQHLMMSRVRAVESRRWMLRATNNGYTVAVDPYGRIVAEMATDVRGELDAPYDFRTDRSLYSLWGDWIAWLSLLASAALIGWGLLARPERSLAEIPAAAPASREPKGRESKKKSRRRGRR